MKEGLEKDTKKLDSLSMKDGENNAEVGKKKGKEERPPTKVVVRRLPPTMTEEEFLQQIEPLPAVDYMYYVPADLSLSPHAFCRAYLNFVNQSDIFIFTQKFDGYVFVDSKGLEYPAVVEFAPFQRIPKQRPGRKKDPKAGTLETDVMYTSFLEKLNAQIQENTTTGGTIKQHFFETNVALTSSEENKLSTTPLLDFLRTRHAERLRAREEKRKKDMERKRARDEQRRSAKKSEDEPTVLKVLPTQANSVKDKFKEKEVIKPIKKRGDERIKEPKSRIWKSYTEERQKQLEKREEQRKKYVSSSLSSKPSKATKLSIDQKSSEQIAEIDISVEPESKKTENDQKVSDNDTKKDSYYEKKSYQHKHSQDLQKHYDYNKRDDDIKRKSRDNDRLNKTKDSYHDHRDDRYNLKKKVINDFKKNYNRYDDCNKDKYKKEHYSSKKGVAHSGTDKKFDNATKSEKVISESSGDANENKTEDVGKTEQKDQNPESAIKHSVVENSGKSTDLSADHAILKIAGDKETKSTNDLEETTELSKNSDQIPDNSGLDHKVSIEVSEKNLPSPIKDKIECSDGPECNDKIKKCAVESSPIPIEETLINDSEKLSSDKNDISPPTKVVDSLCPAEEKCEAVAIGSESGNNIQEDNDTKIVNKLSGEVVLKRRNSMEMYKRKDENNDNKSKRDNTRRSSLESGDQHKSCVQLEQDKYEKKKSDSDCSESKPKDPRTERRIRNKDRPSIEIYRPGMGRFSKQRLEREKVLGSSTEIDSNSTSPSPTLIPKHKSSLLNHN